jgi:tetratricopeptide (TPR) repeat protein
MTTEVERIKISGYLFDGKGIRDRFLSWRYFGLWENAESVCLVKHNRGNHGGLDLVFEFKNCRKPVRITGSNGIKEGIKLAEVLEYVRSHVPRIKLFGDYTENLLNVYEDYRRFEKGPEYDPETALAMARMHMASVDYNKGRKLLRDIMRPGNSLEYPALFLYLESLVEQDEEIEAAYAFRQLLERHPDDWPARKLWANYHLFHARKGTEDVVLDALSRSPDETSSRELETGLAIYLSQEKRYDESLAILEDLLAADNQIVPEEQSSLEDIRDEVFNLKTDIKYRRKETIFKPLRSMTGIILWFVFMGMIFLIPPSVALYGLIADYRIYGHLEREGKDAASYRVIKSPKKMDFGRSRVSYAFSDKPEIEISEPFFGILATSRGSVVLFNKEADKLLKHPHQYGIRYLESDRTIHSVYPIPDRILLATALNSVRSFLFLIAIVGVALWMWIGSLLKRARYETKGVSHGKKLDFR